MWAMVLCAGRGDRMRPLTRYTPKPLLSVAGEPLLNRHLSAIARTGITDVVINLHHLGEQIRSHVGDGSRFGLAVSYTMEPRLLETAGGIASALRQRDDNGDPFLVVSGDVYTDMDLTSVVSSADRLMTPSGLPMLASLVLVANPPHHPDGDFGLDHENRLTTTGDRHTYSGIGVFSPALFVNSPDDPSPLRDLLFPAARERRLTGALYSGVWEDVGTPERLRRLSDEQQKRRRPPSTNAEKRL